LLELLQYLIYLYLIIKGSLPRISLALQRHDLLSVGDLLQFDVLCMDLRNAEILLNKELLPLLLIESYAFLAVVALLRGQS
jgi:hypothetical protein